jgi:hypothetical protein
MSNQLRNDNSANPGENAGLTTGPAFGIKATPHQTMLEFETSQRPKVPCT